MREHRINGKIKSAQVRLVDEEGRQAGVFLLAEAIRRAQSKGLDLVEVAPDATPPVCRIIDYGKYKYRMHKKEREAKKHHKVIVVKEVKLRPKIDPHDMSTKVNHAKEFLIKGDRVKFSIMFRGREIVHQEIGHRLLGKAVQELTDIGIVESGPHMEGNTLQLILAPNPKAKVRETTKEVPINAKT